MPSKLFACLGCGGGAESDDIRVLDYRHCALKDVPSDVFASERTLEELELDSNQISELPRQLFYCHGLKELGLSDNELTSLPPAVASLINLNSIDLSKNAISDIPDNIKGCKQLSVVDASINPLCRLPEGFTQLLSLQELYLNDTFLEYLPANFGRLSRLRILELRENQLNTLPKSMGRLTNLQRLDIGQNDFSELPEVIGSLGNLTELWFDNNKVKSLPPLMGKLKKLIHVDASKNKIDWVTEELEHCSQLTDLHLSSNDLKELPEKLGCCRNLQVLRLDDNALTHLPEAIGGLVSLEELVVTQNDLELLPASIGLLRKLHTLHLDDNLLAELPPELGSCTSLTVLTVASNRLTSVPAEVGHMPKLAVLNLCDNLLHHLPVSLTKLKLRALWLSENQNKPQVQLQSETLAETGQRVLTCFMLPQQSRNYQPESLDEADTFPGQGWDEQRKAKTLIKFAFDGDMDKPGRLTRAPTPYPKELKALAKHARNLNSLQKDAAKQFVLGRSKDSPSKISASSVTSPTKEEFEMKSVAKDTDAELKQPLLSTPSSKSNMSDNAKKAGLEDNSVPLTVVEPQLEERPLLKEARNVRNVPVNVASNNVSDSAITQQNGPKSMSTPVSNSQSPEQHYAIGDRKVFGLAQVVSVSQAGDKVPTATQENSRNSLVMNEPKPVTGKFENSSLSSTPRQISSLPDGESQNDSPDKRIKKPPPYHIAAVMSRHAADFQESSVDVPTTSAVSSAGSGLTVKEIPSSKPTSLNIPTIATAEEEGVDTSSSSDSGYGNGSRSVTQPHTTDDSVSSPSSPQNTDSNFTMPSTPSSPLSPSSPVKGTPVSNALSHSALSTLTSPLPTPALKAGDRHSHAGIQSSITPSFSSPMYSSQQLYSPAYTQRQYPPSGEMRSHMHNIMGSHGRPASIATGPHFEKQGVSSNPQRPGSLALGTLADSALLNRIPHEQRPGSLAAPINTVGIPPAPTRAMSYMGLNVTSPNQQRDPSIFRSQDILGSSKHAWSSELQESAELKRPLQQSNGLVSIIDQVATGILEHGESPPPKTPTSNAVPQPSTVSSSLNYSLSISSNSSVSTIKSHTTTTDSSTTNASGLTNFTQDQPRGEVLHPTPHRPPVLASPKDEHTPGLTVEEKVVESLESNCEKENNPPKPLTRIPSLTSGVRSHTNSSGHNKIPDSQNTSHTPKLSESRIPSFGKGRITLESKLPGLSHTKSSQDAKEPPQNLTKIPHNLSSNQNTIQGKGTLSDNQVSMQHSNVNNSNNSGYNNSHFTPDSKKPLLTSMGRSPSNLSNDSHSTGESRIPVKGGMVRQSSNLTRDNVNNNSSSKLLGVNNTSIPAPGSVSSVSNNNKNDYPSGIPSLAAQGRSNSGLGSSIPVSGSNIRGETPKPYSGNTQAYRPLVGQTSSSRIQTPGFSSGIRPPGMNANSPGMSSERYKSSPASQIQSPSVKSPSQYQSPSGYNSGLRQPSVNTAINTPGIPLLSPSHNNPGSRGSISSTGSGSRIPLGSGYSSSKLPTRVPTSSHSPDGLNQTSSWMFGQHKNARVFPVVIEKNPDLGFTIGQSPEDPEDKSIYVISVTGGGSASSALKVGDKILQVDGSDVRSTSLQVATSVLNKTSNTVNLMVSRLQ